MNDKVFLDSNIVIYSYSKNEPAKQAIACRLIAENNSFISTQVIQELANTAIRKLKFSYAMTQEGIVESCSNNNLHINNKFTVLEACRIASQYFYSFYDSLIIAAAIECECTFLYSEDLQHHQVIDQKLTIINPFV